MDEKLKLMYEENARIHRYYQEWRYRILIRVGIVIAATFLISIQLYEYEGAREFIPYLCFFPSSTALVSFIMDTKNKSMINYCEEAGAIIERKMFGYDQNLSKAFFFSQQHKNNQGYKALYSYNIVLSIIYLSIFFGGICVFFVMKSKEVFM